MLQARIIRRISNGGDSGSGKSTLLNLICLLLKSKNGNYYFNDEIVKNEFEIKKIENEKWFNDINSSQYEFSKFEEIIGKSKGIACMTSILIYEQ